MNRKLLATLGSCAIGLLVAGILLAGSFRGNKWLASLVGIFTGAMVVGALTGGIFAYLGILQPGIELPGEVQRELLVVKVRADMENRHHVVETINLFGGKVIDVSPETVTIEATGGRDKLEALLKVLEPYGIKELVQSGMVAMGRGSRSITDRSLRPAERSA